MQSHCLKSRWNISAHSNLYHKTNTAQRIYFELKWSLIFMFLIILYLVREKIGENNGLYSSKP